MPFISLFLLKGLLELGQGVLNVVAHDGLSLLRLLPLHFSDEFLLFALQLLESVLAGVGLRGGREAFRFALFALFGFVTEDRLVELQLSSVPFVLLQLLVLLCGVVAVLKFVVVAYNPLLSVGGDFLV